MYCDIPDHPAIQNAERYGYPHPEEDYEENDYSYGGMPYDYTRGYVPADEFFYD